MTVGEAIEHCKSAILTTCCADAIEVIEAEIDRLNNALAAADAKADFTNEYYEVDLELQEYYR